MVNHYENHGEVTTKDALYKNLKAYYESKNSNVFFAIPLTFCLKISPGRQQVSIKNQIKPFKEVFDLIEQFKEQWSLDSDPDAPM